MECPVCHHKNIPAGARECPNCHSDLESFQLIRDLERNCRNRRIVNLILGILAAILLVLWIGTIFYMQEQSKEIRMKASEYEVQIEALTQEKHFLTRQNLDLKEKVTQLELQLSKKVEEPEIITHVIEYGETLFEIAEMYFGNGYLYDKIACDNGLEDPDFIVEGNKLYIYKYQPRL